MQFQNPNIEELCNTLKEKPAAPEVWTKSLEHPDPPPLRASLHLDLSRRFTAILRRDERVLNNYGLVLELVPGYTGLGWTKIYAVQLVKRMRARGREQSVSAASSIVDCATCVNVDEVAPTKG